MGCAMSAMGAEAQSSFTHGLLPIDCFKFLTHDENVTGKFIDGPEFFSKRIKGKKLFDKLVRKAKIMDATLSTRQGRKDLMVAIANRQKPITHQHILAPT